MNTVTYDQVIAMRPCWLNSDKGRRRLKKDTLTAWAAKQPRWISLRLSHPSERSPVAGAAKILSPAPILHEDLHVGARAGFKARRRNRPAQLGSNQSQTGLACRQNRRSAVGRRRGCRTGYPTGRRTGCRMECHTGCRRAAAGLPHGLPQGLPQGLPHGTPHGLPQRLPQRPLKGRLNGLGKSRSLPTCCREADEVLSGEEAPND